MTVQTTSGAKFYIGSSAAPATLDQAGYETDSSYVLVGEIEDLGELGDESSAVTFAAIGDGRIRKAKGARDAGQMDLVIGVDPLDAGQDALRAAEATNFNYNFKVELPLAPDETYSQGYRYFRGLVMSQREAYGTNDNIMRMNVSIGVNTAVVYVNPTVISV